jgi:hypothetical protein
MPPGLTFVLVFMAPVLFSLEIVVRLHWRGKHARSVTSRPKAERTLLQIPEHRSRPSWFVAQQRATG